MSLLDDNIAQVMAAIQSNAAPKASNDDAMFNQLLSQARQKSAPATPPTPMAAIQRALKPGSPSAYVQQAMNAPAGGFKTGDHLDPRLHAALGRLMAAVPGLSVNSGYRTPEEQAALYAKGVAQHGADVGRWVAQPGHSNHNKGEAVDLGFANPGAIQKAHDLAGQYGLGFPLSNENWHIELAGPRRS